jgi:hypothetical protein
MPSRAERRAEEQAVIATMYPHVLPGWLPSPPQHRRFEPWVLWDDGASDTGDFLGFCPMHDPDKTTEASAEFNFMKNIMRCQGDPPCHEGKRAMSLSNVTVPDGDKR